MDAVLLPHEHLVHGSNRSGQATVFGDDAALFSRPRPLVQNHS